MTKGIYYYIDKKDNQIVYVGKDSNIDKKKRHREHLAPPKYNEQPINRILQNNPDRYIYQVLWEIDDCTDNHLNQMEIFYIKKYDPQFNFTEGGEGTTGYKHSEESRKKMSESQKGKVPWNKGKINVYSEETRKRMSEVKKGKAPWNKGKINVYSEETRKKMSKSKKGENHPMYGKTHSEETRKKISESRNTTGFYRVTKQKDNNCKKGFMWRYLYPYKSTRKSIYSTNLKKLEKKVKAQNLPWQIVNENKARQSLKKDIGDI